MKTYLFYDIETTGLNVAFDQVLQFAAIRTDEQFNLIEETEVRIKLRDDVIPAPEAVLTHLLTPDMMQEGECEVEGIQKIHALMNEPGTISVGYNTLTFDDEFLRFSFYRNLLPPYTHQYANRCGRMDIFPITILFYLFGKADIIWPETDGQVSLKLENLNNANHFATGQAHDAMVDVRATLELAKCLKQTSNMWEYAVGYFDKTTDAERLRQLPFAFHDTRHQEGVLIHPQLGYKNHFQTFALCLGQHRHYRNQWCWLRLDLPELAETSLDSIDKTTWCLRKKLAEAPFVLPPKDRFLKSFDDTRLSIIEKNKAFLQANPEILNAITDHYLDFTFPLVPEADVDSILYQAGFWSNHDVQTAYQFHHASPELKINFLHDFETTETRELALRIIGRNYPELLSGKERDEFQAYQQNAFKRIDYQKREKLTPEAALKRLAETDKSAPEELKKALERFYLS